MGWGGLGVGKGVWDSYLVLEIENEKKKVPNK